MHRWTEDAHLMAGRFVDYRMPSIQAGIILIVQSGVYSLNHAYRWVPTPVMVNRSVVILPILFSLIFKKISPLSAQLIACREPDAIP